MQLDYATTLFKKYAHISDARVAAKAMKTLDKTFLLGFNSTRREAIMNLLPGLSRRLGGGLFGVRSLQSAPLSSVDQVIDTAQKGLAMQDNE
nr:hypothetical protein [Candidatus Saccharibacteria bacterium]